MSDDEKDGYPQTDQDALNQICLATLVGDGEGIFYLFNAKKDGEEESDKEKNDVLVGLDLPQKEHVVHFQKTRCGDDDDRSQHHFGEVVEQRTHEKDRHQDQQ